MFFVLFVTSGAVAGFFVPSVSFGAGKAEPWGRVTPGWGPVGKNERHPVNITKSLSPPTLNPYNRMNKLLRAASYFACKHLQNLIYFHTQVSDLSPERGMAINNMRYSLVGRHRASDAS
jgi:hypothetical protein